VAFRIPDRTLIPEGIAYDPKDDAFYVGSLHKNAIFRIERPGRVARFAPKGADSLWSVAGIEIDPQRRHLWAATAGGPAAGSTALVQYDLETGARLARFAAEPKRGEKRFFNDIAITAGGDVYVTDSDEGSVYRVTAKDRTLEPFAAAGQLVYPNGIALSSDGRALFVADAKAGLSRIEIATGKVEPLGRPAGVCLFGIDGLSRHGRSLIGVVNSAGAERIVRFRLDPSETSVVGSETLDARNPRFQIPTTGAVARDGYYFIANSHLDRLAEDGRIKAGSKLEEVLILRIALD
jgi:DNA-binding beta-propeller fold protein YncE